MASIKTKAPAPEATRETLPSQDLSEVGLAFIGERLKANRADLGEVLEARAKADVVFCPVCPEPHPV